jgi:YbbR domain-containing protein
MRMWVIDNLAIKIGAFLIALFLWFHAVTEQDYEVKREVPIQVIGIPSDLILAQPFTDQASIRLRGKGKQLIVPYFSPIHVLVSAAGAEKGPLTVSLTGENVEITHGSGAALTDIISPRHLDLTFDTLVRKQVPVQSRITLVPMDGYVQVGSITFSPDSILVTGPAQFVNSITSVQTESLTYSGMKKPFIDQVHLVDPEGFNVTYIPHQIEANSQIQRLVQRTVEGIPVTLTNIPKGLSAHLEPSTLSVTISGGEEYLGTLTRDSFSAFADYGRARRRADTRINARINLPPAVELISASPQTFKVITGS